MNFIQQEHPQTMALILSYLDPVQAGQILSELNPEVQAEVARRIAVMDRTSPEIINEVERVLEQNYPLPLRKIIHKPAELKL